MTLEEQIFDLVDNDSYLLWEIMVLAKSRDDYGFALLTITIEKLIKEDKIICLAKSVLGNEPPEILSETNSIKGICVEKDWKAPESDFQTTLYLTDGNFRNKIVDGLCR